MRPQANHFAPTAQPLSIDFRAGSLARTSAAEEKTEFADVPIPEVPGSGMGQWTGISRVNDACDNADVLTGT